MLRPNFGQKTPETISVHDAWEPLKQALSASRDVILSSQICVSKLQRFFTLGDGCWLPKKKRRPIGKKKVRIISKIVGVVSPHLLVGKKFPRFTD